MPPKTTMITTGRAATKTMRSICATVTANLTRTKSTITSHPRRRAIDGWSTESKSTSPWWVTAGIATVSILIVLGLVAGLAGPFLGSFRSNEPVRIEYVPAQVIEVVDVRTIIVNIDGSLATVRYIGIEPLPLESAWYDIAILAHQQLVGNQEVLLEADEIDSDDFGRLLRYVYVDRALVKRTASPQRHRA